MYKTLRLLFTALIALSSLSIVHSQNRTYSPFSRYGIGELSPQGYAQNNAMGRTGIGIRTSQYLNNMNPASLSAIDSMSFFFEAGLEAKTQIISTNESEQNFSNINFDHFAFGFGVGPKMGISLGVKPASSAGNLIKNTQQEESSTNVFQAQSSGNITDLFGNIGYQVTPQLSVGVKTSFWFGNISHSSYIEFENTTDDYLSGTITEHRIRSVFFDFGMQYYKHLGNNKELVLGAVFRPAMGINGESTSIDGRGYGYNTDGSFISISDTLATTENSIFDIPMKIGLGASFSIAEKLILAADYSTENWAESNFDDGVTETANANYLALGVEFIPNERAANNYLNRIRYRAGVHYNESYIKLNGYQLNDVGVSFGLGLPLERTKSSVNLGFEYGKIGTKEANQINETYSKFTISFTMHENWFMKRKFD